jgi:transcriptional regulator with XRE-family HTH domain
MSQDNGGSKKASAMDAYIGGRLRLWRRTMDVDANILAARIGITYQQLQKYEKGINRISAARLFAISRELNVPIDYFFQEAAVQQPLQANEPGNGFDHRVLVATEFGPDLLKCFVSIEDLGVRNAVLALVRSIGPRRAGAQLTS